MMARPRVLSGRYRIEDVLGEGGMARVHLATDLLLDRPVAVKLLRPELAGDEDFVARFAREARLAAGLSHPGIVSVFDTGTDEAASYIVMEFVGGRTLDALLREGPVLPERAAEIAGAVASALAAAHRAGVVHCDVKPSNVMITRAGGVKVMDFGIALASTDGPLSAGSAVVLGTAAYMSPERARGEAVDARCDIYSLGVVLYEMLCGRPPFVGDPVIVARRHVRDRPPRPSQLDRSVPRALEAVALRAMQKEPSRRYQTAEQLRMDLERVRRELEEMDTGAAHPTARRSPVRADRRPRRRWPAMVLAELAVAAALIALILLGSRGSAPAGRGGNGTVGPSVRPRISVFSPTPSPRPTPSPTPSPSASAGPSSSPTVSPSPSPSTSPTPSNSGGATIIPSLLPSIFP